MKKKFKTLYFGFYYLVFTIIMSFSSFSFAEDYQVIINKKNNVQIMTTINIKKIFLGKKTLWNQNERIRVAFIDVDSDTAKYFFEKVIGMRRSKYNRYWRRKLFSGSGVPPRKFKSKRKLVEFVNSDIFALGVIFGEFQSDEVKIITIE